MKRLAIIAFAAAAVLQSCATTSGDVLDMFVGTYTSKGSEGIYSFTFNQNNGEWVAKSSTKSVNPSFLALSPDGTILYAVNELGPGEGRVEAFRAAEDGSLTPKGSQAVRGADPCYISTDGNFLLAANYSLGCMDVFPLLGDGGLTQCFRSFNGTLGGPSEDRQGEPHVHCAVFTPDGDHILASDFSGDKIMRFDITDGEIKLKGSTPVRPDTGPRHITFSPDGKFAYCIGELSGEVTVFKYSKGELEEIQRVLADNLSARGAADIHISPDGKFLYASLRLKGDGIAIFSRNSSTGMLAEAGYQATGIHPRNFAITPNGKWLLCACRDDDTIQIYKRDGVTGLLEDTGNAIPVSMPVCVIFR